MCRQYLPKSGAEFEHDRSISVFIVMLPSRWYGGRMKSTMSFRLARVELTMNRICVCRAEIAISTNRIEPVPDRRNLIPIGGERIIRKAQSCEIFQWFRR